MNLRNKNVHNIDTENKVVKVDAYTYTSRAGKEGVHIDWESDTFDIFEDEESICIYPADIDRMIKCLQMAKQEYQRVKNHSDSCVECTV